MVHVGICRVVLFFFKNWDRTRRVDVGLSPGDSSNGFTLTK